ncbi:hypothetical protein RN02_30010 [Pseudomonas sp. PI1]|nr:hypothetical protein RN02_30010 [Pseudomonas sp. PI1]
MVVPELNELSQVLRTGRQRPSILTLHCSAECLGVLHLSAAQEGVDLVAVKIIECDDLEWGSGGCAGGHLLGGKARCIFS